LSQKTWEGSLSAPTPVIAIAGSLQVRPPSRERDTAMLPLDVSPPSGGRKKSRLAISATPCLASKAGAGSPAWLPRPNGT
jgi:hypothetical protein